MKDVIAGSWAKLCAGTQDADGKAHKEGPLSKLCQTPKTGSGKIMHGFKVGSLAYIDNNNRLRTWDVKSKKIPPKGAWLRDRLGCLGFKFRKCITSAT